MPYGKYKGLRASEVPTSFWLHLHRYGVMWDNEKKFVKDTKPEVLKSLVLRASDGEWKPCDPVETYGRALIQRVIDEQQTDFFHAVLHLDNKLTGRQCHTIKQQTLF